VAWAAQNKSLQELKMKIESLRELFETELSYAYDAEQKLVKKGLPTMIEEASSPELKRALEQHLQETRNHVTRLERVFSAAGLEPKTKGNDIFDEMESAVKDTISHIESSPLRDAALIVNGNKVEHYEMAIYGSLLAFAQQLGLRDIVASLQQTLEEEKTADAKLTQLAETSINPTAAQQQRAA
jgi:ferritin-like metal-binding protein YciE